MTVNDQKVFKKKFINYFDIALAVVNVLIIIVPLIVFHEVVILSIIGIFLSGGLLTLAIYSFTKNNPLYIYYIYVILFYGILFIIPSAIKINPAFGVLLFLDVVYMYFLVKHSSHTSAISSLARAAYIGRYGARYGFNAQKLTQHWDNINPALEAKKQQQQELLEKQYHSKKILATSLILSVSLLVIFILFTTSLVS